MDREKQQKQPDIMEEFANLQSKTEISEVLKELFNKEKIEMIGDLSHDEIKLCTRIYTVSKVKDIPIWRDALEFYAQMLLSKDRKSRKEIIDAVKGISTQKSLMQRMNPFNWGR